MITPFYSCLPTAALLAPFCHLRPSLGFSSSFTFFPVSSFLYPTPVLSPWGVLFDLAPSFLNHVEIFGCFFVISSPLLLSLSSFSFFFFAAAAVCSPHYFFFISKFARPIAFFIRFWAPLSPFVSLSCLPQGKFLSPFPSIVVFRSFSPDPPALAAGFGFSCGFSIFCTFLWGSPSSLIRFLDVGDF